MCERRKHGISIVCISVEPPTNFVLQNLGWNDNGYLTLFISNNLNALVIIKRFFVGGFTNFFFLIQMCD